MAMDNINITSDLNTKFRMSIAATNQIRMAATVLTCNSTTFIHRCQLRYFTCVFQKSISPFVPASTVMNLLLLSSCAKVLFWFRHDFSYYFYFTVSTIWEFVSQRVLNGYSQKSLSVTQAVNTSSLSERLLAWEKQKKGDFR